MADEDSGRETESEVAESEEAKTERKPSPEEIMAREETEKAVYREIDKINKWQDEIQYAIDSLYREIENDEKLSEEQQRVDVTKPRPRFAMDTIRLAIQANKKKMNELLSEINRMHTVQHSNDNSFNGSGSIDAISSDFDTEDKGLGVGLRDYSRALGCFEPMLYRSLSGRYSLSPEEVIRRVEAADFNNEINSLMSQVDGIRAVIANLESQMRTQATIQSF
jgi:hypothetical protein